MYLYKVVLNMALPPDPISNEKAKKAHIEILKSLIEDKEKYLYRFAIYRDSAKIYRPHDLYYIPYIQNAICILFFKHHAPYKDVSHDKLTVSLMAFISTLVYSYATC